MNAGENNIWQHFSREHNQICYLNEDLLNRIIFCPVFRHLLRRKHGVSRLGQKDNLGAEVPQQCHHNQRGGKIRKMYLSMLEYAGGSLVDNVVNNNWCFKSQVHKY